MLTSVGVDGVLTSVGVDGTAEAQRPRWDAKDGWRGIFSRKEARKVHKKR